MAINPILLRCCYPPLPACLDQELLLVNNPAVPKLEVYYTSDFSLEHFQAFQNHYDALKTLIRYEENSYLGRKCFERVMGASCRQPTERSYYI